MKYKSRLGAKWGGHVLALGLGMGLVWGTALAEEPKPSEMMPLAPKSLLLDIDKAGSRYVVVGERGHALVSTDGSNFEQKQTPVRASLNAVDFVDGNNGWAVGHDAVILKSSDGGETWSLQNWDPELEKALLDVMFLDAQRGFAIGAYGLFMRTTNGGSSWEMVENDVTMDEWHFTSMTRLNDGALLLAGEAGGLAMSRDEGETWVQLESPYEGSYFGALPWGDAGAIIYGLRGNVFITDALPALDEVQDVAADAGTDADAGMDDDLPTPAAEWTHLKTGTIQSFMGGNLVPGGGAVLVGVNGVVLHVSADGSTKLVKNPITVSFSAAISTGGNNFLVVGEGGTYPFSY